MKIEPSGTESNRAQPHQRDVQVIVTDRHNAQFAAEYITTMLHKFFEEAGIPTIREKGYTIIKIETTEWEISK